MSTRGWRESRGTRGVVFAIGGRTYLFPCEMTCPQHKATGKMSTLISLWSAAHRSCRGILNEYSARTTSVGTGFDSHSESHQNLTVDLSSASFQQNRPYPVRSVNILIRLSSSECSTYRASRGRSGAYVRHTGPYLYSRIRTPNFSKRTPLETSHVQFPISSQRNPLDFLLAQQQVQSGNHYVRSLPKLFR